MRLNKFILPVLPALALAAPQQTQTKAAQPCSDLSCSEPPPDGKVHIRDTQASGSGCPPSSVSIQISKDRQTVTIGMSQMSSYYGYGFTSKDNSHNCAIHTILEYPGGYQYSVMTATYNGGARLDPGVSAYLQSSYFFSQNPSVIKHTRTTIQGPQYVEAPGAPFQKVDTANDKTFIWSPCGEEGILNVNNILSLSAGGKDRDLKLTGEVSAYDATIQFKQEVAIIWRKCGTAERAAAEAAKQTKSNGGRIPGPRAEDQTFTPTVYSNDMGDWRRPHALTDFETELVNPPIES